MSVNDLNQIAQRSHNIAKRKKRNTFNEEDLREAVADYMPDYSPEMRLFMVLLALARGEFTCYDTRQTSTTIPGICE